MMQTLVDESSSSSRGRGLSSTGSSSTSGSSCVMNHDRAVVVAAAAVVAVVVPPMTHTNTGTAQEQPIRNHYYYYYNHHCKPHPLRQRVRSTRSSSCSSSSRCSISLLRSSRSSSWKASFAVLCCTTALIQILLCRPHFAQAQDTNPPFFTTLSPAAPAAVLPTRGPTPAPVVAAPPTKRPTFKPTRRPTGAPIVAASGTPSGTPLTIAPSTAAPSRGPSTFPTVAPYAKPSLAPSGPPSAAPTLMPSMQPSIDAAPTSATVNPTVSPAPTTLAPSAIPTVTPTARPPVRVSRTPTTTVMPSSLPPVVAPPSTPPSSKPRPAAPSSKPSRVAQSELVPVTMVLTSTLGKLVDDVAINFEAVTKAFLEAQLKLLTFEVPVTSIEADVAIASQTLVVDDNNNRLRERQRHLQAAVPLSVAFNVNVQYQSAKQDYNAGEWIASAFDSEEKRQSYIARLKIANSAEFGRLENVKVAVEGQPPPAEVTPSPVEGPGDNDKNGGDDRTQFWIIVGAAVGGALLLLLGVGVLARISSNNRRSSNNSADVRKNNRRPGKQANAGTSLAPGATSSRRFNKNQQSSYGSESAGVSGGGANKLAFSAEIDVDRQDDVSTLGDPVFGSMRLGHNSALGGADEDQLSESIGTDYDYVQESQNFLGTMPSHEEEEEEESESFSRKLSDASGISNVIGGEERMEHDVIADDSSFDEQFGLEHQRYSVEVPAGKLGMVIDTPNGGPPIVHAIKAESILIDRVRAGDQLVAVDHEDVTSMTAVQVSKLISLKSDQTRLLAFVRARGRFDSADLVLKEGAC